MLMNTKFQFYMCLQIAPFQLIICMHLVIEAKHQHASFIEENQVKLFICKKNVLIFSKYDGRVYFNTLERLIWATLSHYEDNKVSIGLHQILQTCVQVHADYSIHISIMKYTSKSTKVNSHMGVSGHWFSAITEIVTESQDLLFHDKNGRS